MNCAILSDYIYECNDVGFKYLVSYESEPDKYIDFSEDVDAVVLRVPSNPSSLYAALFSKFQNGTTRFAGLDVYIENGEDREENSRVLMQAITNETYGDLIGWFSIKKFVS